jgi:thioredoxin-dependent peroxiredoxin
VIAMARIQVGDPAPDFTIKTHAGEEIRLSQFRNQKAVVLFFYPKDNTAICTREACAFRDAYEQFVDAGAVVIGVSADSSDSHGAFAAKHNLPFHLASDADGSLRKLFGVPKTLGLLPGRVTYVIDKQGIVQLVFNAQLTADGHVQEALKALGLT